MVPRQNDYSAPTCPFCCHAMRKAGRVKTQVKIIDANLTTFIPKQRWRCDKCHYGETVDSTAHNSNHRTGYGITKFTVLNKPLSPLQFNTSQDNCPNNTGFKQAQILSFTTPN